MKCPRCKYEWKLPGPQAGGLAKVAKGFAVSGQPDDAARKRGWKTRKARAKMKTMTQDEFLAEAKARFGENVRDWKFVCPMCGTIQSVQQLLDAVIASGGTKEDVHGYIGFSCIGRFTRQGDAGIAAKNRGEKWDNGCNWTLGGLLRCHELEVVMPDGHKRPTFELAEAEPALA